MTTYDVNFHTVNKDDFRCPYVRDGESVVYEYDESSSKGTIAFNGYYYVENGPPPYPEDSDPDMKPWDRPRRHSEWLPKKAAMSLTHRDKEPYKRVADKENKFMTHIFYKEYKKVFFMIEIYKLEVYEYTNEISEIDDDGEPMKVCFFPTNQIKLWFRVLEDFNETIMPKRVLFRIHIMPNTLYADSDEYKKILAWGQNTSDEWYHPVSRHQFAKGLTEIKVGDLIPFSIDGLSQPVEVLEIVRIYDYPKMRHVNGDFHISTLLVDRVIRVKRV